MPNSQQNPSASVRPHTTAVQPSPLPAERSSPPSKRDLTSWWKQFKRNTKKQEAVLRIAAHAAPPWSLFQRDDGCVPPFSGLILITRAALEPSTGIFGVPLNVSIKYANVAISLTGEDGKSFVYGYVPIVVAKCGVFLKEKATDVEGIFRLSGSAKRIKDLQEVFNTADRYGKGLDWTGYTVHDAANVLRRYLNQLPEPIVPLDFYERFRDPLRPQQTQSQKNEEDEPDGSKLPNREETVAMYQKLIKELPPLNRQLLLYILDLLTVFASKSDLNRMTAANLAAIFQPGMLSHPNHDMSPAEYKLSQDVLIFLIENQDNFLFGMNGTAADAQTVKEMEEGIYAQPQKSKLRRSVSNASGGPDSLRKYENLRRNVSVSSRHSRNPGGHPGSPPTPKSINSFGVHRSNTVPSKRPPGLSPTFNRSQPAPSLAKPLTPAPHSAPLTHSGTKLAETTNISKVNKPEMRIEIDRSASTIDSEAQADHNLTEPGGSKQVVTPSRERKLASLFVWSSPPDDGRQPNRLRKKRRIPGSASESAQSSTHSLHHLDDVGSPPPPLLRAVSNNDADRALVSTPKTSSFNNTVNLLNTSTNQASIEDQSNPQGQSETLKTVISRTSSPSLNYVTDQSDLEHVEENNDKKEKRRSWRFHRSSRRAGEPASLSMSPPAAAGSHTRARFSSPSLASSNLPILSNEAPQVEKEGSSSSVLSPSVPDTTISTHTKSLSSAKDSEDEERKGFFSKIKARVSHVKEGMRDKESEHARAQSPPVADHDKVASRASLSFFSKDAKTTRGPSVDITRDQHPSVSQPPSASIIPPGPPAPPTIAREEPAPADVVTVLPKVEEEPSPPATVIDKPTQPESSCEPDTQDSNQKLESTETPTKITNVSEHHVEPHKEPAQTTTKSPNEISENDDKGTETAVQMAADAPPAPEPSKESTQATS
ncbi:GTPase activating protein (GAP) for Rho1p [Ophidiomyces ophidiicola]|nr:GTPase activating protein (GAP) for Rho1p [Ophidiomyces ophidiicola]KAI2091168.1 GTPase activating protein (GAP) for Rho1p [Ophidiomyces ophidiicola]